MHGMKRTWGAMLGCLKSSQGATFDSAVSVVLLVSTSLNVSCGSLILASAGPLKMLIERPVLLYERTQLGC